VAATVASELFYARQQMALSLGWHIVLACMGIGFPVVVLIAERRHLRTGDPVYRELAKHWSKILGVLFAVGAVSGTILSFEFGILWPEWMRRYGDVVGLPFAIEGIAFFVEAIFVGIYLYGWDRLPPRVHWWTGVPIAVAGVASAFFVVAANAWMNDPTGFVLGPDGMPTDIRPWDAMFNPALGPEALHMILAALMVAGFLTASVYALAMLRGRRDRFHRLGLLIPLTLACAVAPVQILAGDIAARHVAVHQPVKLAAMEGLHRTESGAPFTIGGIYRDGEVVGGIQIPKLLSLLAFHDPDHEVTGLEAVPADDRPPVNVVRIAFQVMVAIGSAFLVLAAWLAWSWRRRRDHPESKWFLRAAVVAGPAAVVALEAGWVVTEVGRQPWIVYEVMRVEEAVNTADGLRYGYFGLIVVYAALTVATVAVLRRAASERRAGLPPDAAPQGSTPEPSPDPAPVGAP
jgi:cytochrome bd ubiquinol oxidase subunit I